MSDEVEQQTEEIKNQNAFAESGTSPTRYVPKDFVLVPNRNGTGLTSAMIFLEKAKDYLPFLPELPYDYWRFTHRRANLNWGDGSLELTVKDIAKKYGLRAKQITDLVRQYSRLELRKRCASCPVMMTQIVRTRSEFAKRFPFLWECDDCKARRVRQQEEEKERLRREEQASRERQIAQAQELLRTQSVPAYQNEVYLSLKPVQFRVLCELASLKEGQSSADAYKRVGISRERGRAIFNELVGLSLIVMFPDGYAFPDGAKQILHRLKTEMRLRPILNPMEREIFRRLKSQNAVIFPHQLLRTFIPEHTAREALQSFPDITFPSYLCMEVDFLVCDEDYRPIRAIEYQGGYHSDSDAKQTQRDEFKKCVCNLAGVPLTAFEKSSLWRDEELKGAA